MSTRDHPDWWRPMGGQNSQDSILERRSTVWNDSDPQPPPAAPPSSSTDTYKGKFFTRGCRGMIEEIQIYRTATAAGTITLQFSPHPCIGPLYTVVIPAGPANAWTGVAFEQMWDYDSLFIWISALQAGEAWGYDAVQPYDGHQHTPRAGPPLPLYSPWFDLAIRPFIRVVYSGETPGDVPVSGIVNNIRIPNSSTSSVTDSLRIYMGELTLVASIPGAGFVDLMIMMVNENAVSHSTAYFVRCDGAGSWGWSYFDMNVWGFDDDNQPMSLPLYAEAGFCTMMITKKFEFRRLFELYARNNFGDVTIHTRIYPNLIR